MELDLRCTRDDRLVAIHDPTVDRTTDGTGRVEELALDALRELDAGHAFSPDHGRSHPYRGRGVRIPTLEEVLEAAADLAVVAEVKSRRAGEALGRWLRSAHEERRERILVGGFDREMVDPARRHARWSCAYQTELLPYVLLGKIGLGRRFAPGADAAMVPEKHRAIRVVSRGFVRRCHRDGLGVFVWTVNRTEDARRLFDWDVDGIVSDAPGRILRVLHERRAEGDLAEGEAGAPSGCRSSTAEAMEAVDHEERGEPDR